MSNDLMTIGQMCEHFNVTARTLRFYEAKELIFPIRRGTKRLFTRQCRGRLKLILQGKRFGFKLEDIRQLLDLYNLGDHQTTQLSRTCEIAQERLIAMKEQRAELDAAIIDLTKQIADVEATLAKNISNAAAQ